MNEKEILDYYNEHWNDYNKILDMLHDIIDAHSNEIEKLKAEKESSTTISDLKAQLQECQDRLDEETHKQ